MLKSIKIRLYPTKQQEIYISKLLGSCRFVYNMSLEYKKSKYEENKINVGLKELGKYFHNDLTKNPEYEWINEHNTKVIKQSIINMLNSYKNFFKHKFGFPKFKSKSNKQSCRFPVESISSRNDYSSNKLTLTKQLKDIHFKCSTEYKKYLNENKSLIRSGTLSKTKSGKYFLSILIERKNSKLLPETNNILGIDLGIKDFVITSEGEVFENIKIKRNNQGKLKKLHKNLSRKTKGSKNREKSRVKLSRFYEKLNNIKEYYLHKLSNQLLNENQVIVMEDLNVKNMMKNHKLSRSIQELSLNRFKIILKYKADWYGREIIEVDRFFPSSKLCNICGEKNENLTLKDREWQCVCGEIHDRDINAALNILNEGKRIKIGNRLPELTPLESCQ